MHGTVSLGPWGAISIYIYIYICIYIQKVSIHIHMDLLYMFLLLANETVIVPCSEIYAQAADWKLIKS